MRFSWPFHFYEFVRSTVESFGLLASRWLSVLSPGISSASEFGGPLESGIPPSLVSSVEYSMCPVASVCAFLTFARSFACSLAKRTARRRQWCRCRCTEKGEEAPAQTPLAISGRHRRHRAQAAPRRTRRHRRLDELHLDGIVDRHLARHGPHACVRRQCKCKRKCLWQWRQRQRWQRQFHTDPRAHHNDARFLAADATGRRRHQPQSELDDHARHTVREQCVELVARESAHAHESAFGESHQHIGRHGESLF